MTRYIWYYFCLLVFVKKEQEPCKKWEYGHTAATVPIIRSFSIVLSPSKISVLNSGIFHALLSSTLLNWHGTSVIFVMMIRF